MSTFFVAVRDFLLALALSWVGISLERANAPRSEPSPAPPTLAACAGEGALCAAAKPSFDALDCPDQ